MKPVPIHNLMETLVLRVVEEISEEDAAGGQPTYCTTPDCRMDVACFVLNRIPQRYVNSARGQAHVEDDLHNDMQLRVDVVTLVHEGLRRVTSTRRSFYDQTDDAPPVEGPVFCLPILKGRLFNGLDFTPIIDVPVQLRLDDELIPMTDNRWSNPYIIPSNTPGTYIFLPRPLAAGASGEQRTFEFELRVEDDRYEPFHHFLTVDVTSRSAPPDLMDASADHRVPDLYVLPAV